MGNRKKRKRPNKLVEWLTPLHQWLYPPMTEKRRIQLQKNLKNNRNVITRLWRHIEDFPLAKPPYDRVLVLDHTEEDYEDDRRRLRLRLFYWACLFAPLIYLEWMVVSLILGGFTLMIEFFQWGTQLQRLNAYPDWKPGRMKGWIFLLLILEIAYIAICFGIFNYQNPGYWAVVTFPFFLIAMYIFLKVVAYAIELIGYLCKKMTVKVSGKNDADVMEIIDEKVASLVRFSMGPFGFATLILALILVDKYYKLPYVTEIMRIFQ